MDYLQLFQTLVLPLLFLAGVLAMLLMAGRWLILHVVRPWTERHLSFVDRMQQATTEHTIVLAAMLKAQEQHVRVLTQMVITLRAIQTDVTFTPKEKQQ